MIEGCSSKGQEVRGRECVFDALCGIKIQGQALISSNTHISLTHTYTGCETKEVIQPKGVRRRDKEVLFVSGLAAFKSDYELRFNKDDNNNNEHDSDEDNEDDFSCVKKSCLKAAVVTFVTSRGSSGFILSV